MIDAACLSDDEVRQVVRDEIRKGLRDILAEELRHEFRTHYVAMGVDDGDPLEIQADTRFLRQLRRAHETVMSKALSTAVGLIVVGSVSLLIIGLIQWIRKQLEG